MIAFGLTGGIGSGKSTVSSLLAQKGAIVLDLDLVARQVVEPGTAGHDRVVETFGRQVLGSDGAIDRRRLAEIVFGGANARRVLESIVHPAVGAVVLERLAEEAGTDHVVVIDIPLLVETGGMSRYPIAGVIVVDTSIEVAVRRILGSREMTEAEARARIAAQATPEQRLGAADYVIHNDGTLSELADEVDGAWQWVISRRDVRDEA